MNYLTKEQGNVVVNGLVNDPTITDYYFEEILEHIRDDFCFHIRKYGYVNVDDLVEFHGYFVKEIIDRYL